jgi:3-deoxy-D-manno-octulosonic-acid transferase
VIWRALYSAALYAVLPFVLLKLWWRGRSEPEYRARIGERFGRYTAAQQAGVLWVHAVSVGEARASAPLVRALHGEWPDARLLLTCTTATGHAALRQIHGESQQIVWLPYDYPGSVRRFLAHFRPRLAVLVETEIWPNLLRACAQSGVPVVVASARMSERSALGYRRWSGLARPAFASLAAVCAQSEADARRLGTLGAAQVSVCGNLKFDVAPDAAQLEAGRAWRRSLGRRVVLLASTRDGEERLLLEAAQELPQEVLVIVVPRHPQRFESVAALLGAAGVARRSREDLPQAWQRFYLGDSMGEMAFYYAAADVAVIGGSFLPLGGQNLIEACAAGTPAIFGPSMHNFAEASLLALEAGASLQARDAREAMHAVQMLLSDESRRHAMGEAGLRLCAAHRGATRRHLAIVQSVLAGR